MPTARALVATLLPFVIAMPLHAAPGDPVGVEFQVNTYTTGTQNEPVVVQDPAGGFVVIWRSPASAGDTSGDGIWARRFDAAGAPRGDEFQVNTWTTGDQRAPAVAANGSHGFIVVWDSDGGSPGTDTDSVSVQGQLLDATGSPLGAEFQVNTYTTQYQSTPAVVALTEGFVVVWQSYGSVATQTNIKGQRFDATGTPISGEFQVNTYETGFQRDAAVASLEGGGFVVVW